MADQQHNKPTHKKVIADLRAATCGLGYSAMRLYDVAQRAAEEQGESVGPVPTAPVKKLDFIGALRRARVKLEASNLRMKLANGKYEEERREQRLHSLI